MGCKVHAWELRNKSRFTNYESGSMRVIIYSCYINAYCTQFDILSCSGPLPGTPAEFMRCIVMSATCSELSNILCFSTVHCLSHCMATKCSFFYLIAAAITVAVRCVCIVCLCQF